MRISDWSSDVCSSDLYGSYPLAIAAYNAGPGNVNKWLAANGDPRTGTVDMIGWIEAIPFTETRNYVQRVLENRSEEHTSELQSLMRISYAVFCLNKKKKVTITNITTHNHPTIQHTQNSTKTSK